MSPLSASVLHACWDGWELPPAQAEALVEAYAQPPRAYHHLGHVADVIAHAQAIAAGPGWQSQRELYLAICYHDAIYVAGRRDNEARSADLARAHCARHLQGSGIDVDWVAELILLTARHGSVEAVDLDRDAAQFLDCDMAILAADASHFDAYDLAIAQEYRGVVPAFLFRFNRRRFLKGLLARPQIYLSDHGRTHWETLARANLRRALG